MTFDIIEPRVYYWIFIFFMKFIFRRHIQPLLLFTNPIFFISKSWIRNHLWITNYVCFNSQPVKFRTSHNSLVNIFYSHPIISLYFVNLLLLKFYCLTLQVIYPTFLTFLLFLRETHSLYVLSIRCDLFLTDLTGGSPYCFRPYSFGFSLF